jgi:hypothetical protein
VCCGRCCGRGAIHGLCCDIGGTYDRIGVGLWHGGLYPRALICAGDGRGGGGIAESGLKAGRGGGATLLPDG